MIVEENGGAAVVVVVDGAVVVAGTAVGLDVAAAAVAAAAVATQPAVAATAAAGAAAAAAEGTAVAAVVVVVAAAAAIAVPAQARCSQRKEQHWGPRERLDFGFGHRRSRQAPGALGQDQAPVQPSAHPPMRRRSVHTGSIATLSCLGVSPAGGG